MAKRFFTRDASKGMDLENGKRHYDSNGKPLGGIKAKVVNTDNQEIEVEQGEVILNRKSMNSSKVLTVKGTPKQIASTINQLDGNGVAISDSEAKVLDMYKRGGEIPTLIEKGVVDLKFHETTPEHAEIYGLTAEKPLYIQTLYVNDNKRLKGIGTKVLHYIYSIAKQNGNDVIFGHINQKASFTKDEKETTFNDIDMVKNWLHKNGYAINEDNNDFHKVVKFKTGGSIGDMTPSELKDFYASDEGKKLDAKTYAEWKRLVNMTKSELEDFYNSPEGKQAGLSKSEATKKGVDSGRESAEWIMKMKDIPYKDWTSDMWRWAKKQISFIKRMSGMKGDLYDDKGRKTRKHTALLIWGHNPEQKFKGGGYVPRDVFTKSENERNEDYEANWNLWTETLLKNESLPIYWTTSESRKELYGDSFYITIFNEDWQEFAKLRFSGHSVMNTSRLQNEFHNPSISRFYEIVSRAMNLKQQEKYPENSIKFEGGGSIEKEEEMEKEIPKYAMIDDEQFEVIGVNHKLDKVRIKNFASGETFEMPIDKWIVESLELGTQAKFKANGREYVGMVVIKNGQKSISLYKDDNYSGDAERIVPIIDVDIATLKPTMKKEMFMSGGNIEVDLTIDSFFSKDNDFILDYIVKTLKSDTKHNFSDYKNKTLKDIAESTRDCMFAYSDIDVNNPIRIKKCNDIKVCFKPKENDYSLDELIIYFAHIVTQDSSGKRIFSKTKKDAIIYIINVIQHPEVIYKQSEYSFLFEKKEPINKSNQTFCVVLYTEYVSENLLRIVTILPDQKLNQIENKKEDGKLIPTSFEELRYAISPSVTGVVGNKGELLTDYNANIENKIDSSEESENKLNKKEMFELGGGIGENEKIEYFKPYKSVEELAELHRVPVSKILEQLHIGEKVEMEHTTDYEIARIITLQHIEESPKYYTLLEGMEKKFETGGEVDIAQSNKIVFKPITTPL